MALQEAVVLVLAMQGILLFAISDAKKKLQFPADQCFSRDISRIPKTHIYYEKCKPLIIGHRGNPKYFQENTLDGFISLEQTAANGFEVDVFMSADGQLVCFHDENAKKLTGVDRNIEEMTAAEIRNLRYKKDIVYGSQTVNYDQRRPVAFLQEVLQWASGKPLLVYIEMKPAPKLTPAERQAQIPRCIEMGSKVAAMVKAFGVQNQVVVNSFDPLKTLYAKYYMKDLVVGNSWIPMYWQFSSETYDLLKFQLKQFLPGFGTCLEEIPTTDNIFINFLFRSGSIEKSMNASFVDIELTMFGNSYYGGCKRTMKMLRKNYGKKTVIGAYTLFDVSKTDAQIEEEIPTYRKLLREGVHLFYTDDIEEMAHLTRGHRRCRGPKRPYYN